MIVVSDTTIISNLFQADLLYILPALYKDVIIPGAVALELSQLDETLPGAIGWLQVRIVNESERVDAMLVFLDRGESEAIVLAQELQADWLLIDEQRGRRYAKELPINITGTMGVLLTAKQAGLISSVEIAIWTIQQKAGAWYHASLIEEVLRQANER